MSEAGQDWARRGAAAGQDASIASFAAGGALLLWDRDAQRPGFANAAGHALLGGDAAAANLPAPTRQRFTLLAGGLASRDGVRLERLRLTAGFSATVVTCGCKLVAQSDGEPVLAIAVQASELRRLGIVIPAPEPVPPLAPIAEPAPVADEPGATPAALTRAIRFLWQSDTEGRLTSLSPNMAELIGATAAGALPGRLWAELVGTDIVDRSGGLVARLTGSATWSGHEVLWRTTPGEGAKVELSGVPVLDAARQVSGFRGFGVVRPGAWEPFVLPAKTPDAMAEAAHDDAVESDPVVENLLQPSAAGETIEDKPEADSAQPESLSDASSPHPGEPQSGVSKDDPDASEATAGIPQDAIPQGTAPQDQGPEVVEPSDSVTAPADLATVASAAEAEIVEALDAAVVAPAQEALELQSPPESQPDETPVAVDILAGAAVASETDAVEAEVAAIDAQAAPEPAPQEPAPSEPTRHERAAPAANIVPLRNGHLTSVRPVLEPSKPNLSSAERNAFREIAKALGARIAGDDEALAPRLPPAAPLRLKEAEPAASADTGEIPHAEVPHAELETATAGTRPRAPNSHADVLDKLPIAVLVNRGEEALYANRTLLDLLDYADLDDLAAGGGVSRLIKEATRTDGGAMILIDRLGHLVSVHAALSSVAWQGEPATLMAFRHPNGGGEVKVLTPEEAEDAELAAEFEAEDHESAARVEALRLDAGARDARINELVAMLDTATDGVVTVDERGRILSLNKTAEALFGYDQREVTGELFTLLFAAESHAPALDYLEGLKGGGVASVMNDGREVVGRVRQGGKIPLFMTMGQIAEGTERRFCAVLRDITAWKKTEGELVEARKAAEKASAQKSDVLAKISHEIRTPLNAIIGFAEVMAEERFGPIANERYKEYLRDIHQSGGYVISLVNDLLDLAKIEAGKLDLDFVSVNLNEIALSAVSLLQPEAQRGRVVLRSGLSPKLPPVVADQRSIRQIVINLLSNAVKFTDAGGQVIISTALGDQGEAILRVRDTGIGMDDKEIELALQPFRQVPTTRRAGGTGLGLPLTKALVEANRAAMSITSVKKEGTLVEITFPPQRVLAG
ncbi:ATP-binding protein [Bosea sp. (in: a-proteobacteria)]|jgi:PAS domain S-box-containing protein|uniref:ATP-binding protein n=1 Tax=Bosea sp. (in: a-proteobacteria) TaxID=1871050 RepID=UPI003561C0BC